MSSYYPLAVLTSSLSSPIPSMRLHSNVVDVDNANKQTSKRLNDCARGYVRLIDRRGAVHKVMQRASIIFFVTMLSAVEQTEEVKGTCMLRIFGGNSIGNRYRCWARFWAQLKWWLKYFEDGYTQDRSEAVHHGWNACCCWRASMHAT